MTDDNLQTALKQCAAPKNMAEAAKSLLAALGYESKREIEEEYNATQFIKTFPADKSGTKSEQYLKEEAELLKIVFQYTEEELQNQLFAGQFDKRTHQSFLFVAIKLRGDDYARGDYARLTREISKRFVMPVVVLFFRAEYLTLSFAKRRINKTDAARDVLENVSLLREINCKDPHRGHVDILMELSLSKRLEWLGKNNKKKEFNFDDLLNAWLDELNTEALNKRFYKELREWFDRAMQTATFPRAKTEEEKNPHIIRLLSRMLFIWFIREKKLVEEKLFIKAQIMPLLTEAARDGGDNYYRAVLQNLFFATLNAKIDERKFREKDKKQNPKYPQHANYDSHRVFQQRRYENLLNNPEKLEEYLDKSPFVNGGLFDCLDPHKSRKDNRVDCFTDNEKDQKQLSVPDALFFDKGEETKGLFPILRKYKFTVEENTPIEQEVALDPELLGKVFENLLVYMKRKSTGSYYTPRVIVDYMLRESLLAHFRRVMDGTKEAALRNLLTEEIDYETTADKLNKAEIRQFINAAGELRLFDPAAGSGAFPMGALTKLTMALRRIDPKNEHLKEREEEAVDKLTDPNHKEDAQRRIKEDFSEKNQYNNYVRKLLLIRDTIFGADIQPIAVQICRLRFFISLAIEQKPNKNKKNNYGISPLPNLETKILAADTLIKLAPADIFRGAEDIKKLEREIKALRERYFSATDRQIKNDCRTKDRQKRKELATMLRKKNYPPGDADKIAEWDLYAYDAAADWFSPEWMFGIKNGFDIVIGNPPYIQLQKDGGQLADLYESQQYKTFTRTSDIYCLFYERGIQLSNPDGHLCYITSNKWLRAGYGKNTRKFLMKKNPLSVIDLGSGIFDATVDTNILMVQNAANKNECRGLTLNKRGREYPTIADITEQIRNESTPLDAAALLDGDSWFIGNAAEVALKNKIEQIGKPLKNWDIAINRGVITGYNAAFIIDEIKKQAILDTCADNAERKRTDAIIKPILRGRDINRYHAKWAKLYLLFIPWHFPLHKEKNIQGASSKAENAFKNQYPTIYNHLLQHKKQLSQRNEAGIRYEWYALQRCANTYYPEFEKEKIIYPNMTKFLPFIFDKEKFLTNQKCFIVTGKNLKYLVGVLNSLTVQHWIRQSLPELQGGTRELSKIFMVNLPIPPITADNKEVIATIESRVEQILVTKAKAPEADTHPEESEVDKLVYTLYNLTEAEIALIEGEAPK